MAIKIFITDDHYMIIEGIRSLLQNEKNIEWLGHAMTAASCLSFLSKQEPEVLLLDVNLPDKSGIDLCREIKQHYPKVKVIGLTSFNQESFVNKMIENGASGYVLKNVSRDELIEAIETVAMGKAYISSDVMLIKEKKDASKVPLLTRREKEVLKLIADGLTNHQIADQLFISTTTVDTHRKNLLEKLNARNTAALVRLGVENHLI